MQSKEKNDNEKDSRKIQPRYKTTFNPKIPDAGKLSYLTKELKKIGYFGSSDSAIRDQEIYYYSKVNQVKFKPFEVEILKDCAQYYVDAFYEFNNNICPPPYSPQETQEEINARDEMMIAKRKARNKK